MCVRRTPGRNMTPLHPAGGAANTRKPVGKAFEAALAARISKFLDERGLLSEFQCGFRTRRRCQHHSFVLAEAVKSNTRSGQKTYAAFLDVRKAYPTMRRSAMLGRLHEKINDEDRRPESGRSLSACCVRETAAPRSSSTGSSRKNIRSATERARTRYSRRSCTRSSWTGSSSAWPDVTA